MESIADQVKGIIIEQLGVKPEQIVPTARFIEDLGADSLDSVELVMAIEEAFDIEISDEDTEKMQTVAQVIAYVEGRKR